ncbi:MAG: nuclear transport factor 2 family protein [Sporichthyaceae bacterium]
MSEERNIATTKLMYDAVPRGDAETVFANLDPEIRIVYYGDDTIPYAGEYEGFEGATKFFTAVGTTVGVHKIEPYTFIADGDNLAVWGHLWFEVLATGKLFDSDFAHIITLREGKWLHFRDFFNSAVASAAFRG